MIYFYIVAILVVTITVACFNTPNGKGLLEELRINIILKKIAKKVGGIEFRDLMIEDSKSSSQIDNLLLTKKSSLCY